jgi:hypothetical protein
MVQEPLRNDNKFSPHQCVPTYDLERDKRACHCSLAICKTKLFRNSRTRALIAKASKEDYVSEHGEVEVEADDVHLMNDRRYKIARFRTGAPLKGGESPIFFG